MSLTIAEGQRKVIHLALALGLIVATSTYAWFALRAYLAHRLSTSPDEMTLQRAITLEPRDAALCNLLGRYLLFGKQNPSAALSFLKHATELNPYDSNYWLDLALGYYDTGAEPQQKEAIYRAIAVDPTTPDVAWNAANFFLVQGNTTDALRQFEVVLRNDPAMVMPSLELCWRALHNVEIIETILPPNPDVYLQLVKLLSVKGESEPAYHIWSAMLQLNKNFDYRPALFYVDTLLERREVARAVLVWNQLVSRSAVLHRYGSTDNLVVDGTFAEDILNAGFDWRYSTRPDTSVSIDTTQFHIGSRSLKISYANSGDDSGIFQYVAVEPNKGYVISAWVKSEELRTANGPRVSVSDAYSNAAYAMTADTVGTTVWHRIEKEFQTGLATNLVAIRFSRTPGNTLIRGQFWVNEVSMRPTSVPKSTQ